MNIAHVTSEAFEKDLISALKSGGKSIELFGDFYLKSDILMFDNIDFLAGKESGKIEFLTIFNNLYESGKQIIITGNRSPKKYREKDFSDNIISRLEWWKVVEIPSNMYHSLCDDVKV